MAYGQTVNKVQIQEPQLPKKNGNKYNDSFESNSLNQHIENDKDSKKSQITKRPVRCQYNEPWILQGSTALKKNQKFDSDIPTT